jgi:hypothetical protein
LEDEGFMKGLASRLSEERRENAPAVLGGIIRKGRADQVGKRRAHVAQADEFVGYRSRLDLPRPADDERHPVTALPNIAFMPPEVHRGLMPVRAFLSPVVARDDEERVVGDPAFLEVGIDLTDHPIE